MTSARAISIVCFLALWPAWTAALDLSQYKRASWQHRDGFTGGARIVAMTQAPDGYLWIGTERGLFRFDGVKATRWQPPAGQKLPDDTIFSVLAARDSTLWIGTRAGLASWRDGTLTQYPELAGQIIDAILEDRAGTIRVGTQVLTGVGRVCAIHAGGAQCDGGDGRFGRAVAMMLEDRAGRLWAESSTGLWRLHPEPQRQYMVPGRNVSLQSFAETDDGSIVLAAEDALWRISGDRLEILSRLPAGTRATRFLRDRRGALWIGTHDRGLVHVHDGRLDVLTREDGYTAQATLSFFEDREGNVWVAHPDGLERFTEPSAVSFASRQGISNRAVNVALAGRDGSIWLATTTALYRWRDGALAANGDKAGVPQSYASLFEDRRGRLWFASNQAVGYLAGGRFVRVSAIPGGYIDSIAEDSEGNLWFAHRDAGLFTLSPRRDVKLIPWRKLGHEDSGWRLAADPRAGIWVGFANGGIAHWLDGRVAPAPAGADSLPAARVDFLRAESDGALWIGTAAGLTRLKDGRSATLNAKHGLPCDTTDWWGEDASGEPWLFMSCGFVRLPRAEFAAWIAAADRGDMLPKVHPSAVLDDAEGVQTAFMRGSATPHVARAPDGRFWLSGSDGATVVDPANLRFNRVPPPVHVERIVADRVTHEASAGLRLPALSRDIEIEYTALAFSAPERVRFRHKLEGRDRDWMDAGGRRRAFYTDLPPGDYRFRIIAANESGVWNEKGDSLAFSIAPAWWQTNAFRISLVAAIALLLYGIYRLRLMHVARQFNMKLDARVNERMRIARDLHDTLLQSFHGLLLKFQAASSMLPAQPDAAKKVLDRAIDQAADAVTEGRDAVQGLRASATETNDLAEAIRTLGEGLASQYGNGDAPTLRLEVLGVSRAVHPILRDEVFRIAGEAMRNAFRHAHARHVEVEVRYDARELRLRVRDDGRGIDTAVLAQGAREGHFGLPGMRERAQSIGGKLTVWSAPGTGTEVELTIPAAHAYALRDLPERAKLE